MRTRTERAIALNGDHLEIVKYRSDQDGNFRTVSGMLSKLVEELS